MWLGKTALFRQYNGYNKLDIKTKNKCHYTFSHSLYLTDFKHKALSGGCMYLLYVALTLFAHYELR